MYGHTREIKSQQSQRTDGAKPSAHKVAVKVDDSNFRGLAGLVLGLILEFDSLFCCASNEWSSSLRALSYAQSVLLCLAHKIYEVFC